MFVNYEKLAEAVLYKLGRENLSIKVVNLLSDKLYSELSGLESLDINKITIRNEVYGQYGNHHTVDVPLVKIIAERSIEEIKRDFLKIKKAEVIEELLKRDLLKELDQLAREEVRKKIDKIIED